MEQQSICQELALTEHAVFALASSNVTKTGYSRFTRSRLSEELGITWRELTASLEALQELGVLQVTHKGDIRFPAGAEGCACNRNGRVVEIAQFRNIPRESGSTSPEGPRVLRAVPGRLEGEPEGAEAAPPARERSWTKTRSRSSKAKPTTQIPLDSEGDLDSHGLSNSARERDRARPDRARRRKALDRWTGLDYARYLNELLVEHWLEQGYALGTPVNHAAVTRYFNEWLRAGREPPVLKLMIELFVRDSSRHGPQVPPWKAFLARREALFQQARKMHRDRYADDSDTYDNYLERLGKAADRLEQATDYSWDNWSERMDRTQGESE